LAQLRRELHFCRPSSTFTSSTFNRPSSASP
ncbi:hypothetical protein A2U01_0078637, partial [Trifolium medium]|nr:hypothetical protein [Trifolium medium]